jgi:hypothetical protein
MEEVLEMSTKELEQYGVLKEVGGRAARRVASASELNHLFAERALFQTTSVQEALWTKDGLQ